MAYTEVTPPVTGTPISSSDFGIKVANNQADHETRVLALETKTSSGQYLISEQSVSVAASSITFSSIPSTYSSLKLIYTARSVATAGDYRSIYVTFNDDGGSNYDLYGISAQATTGNACVCVGLFAQSSMFIGYIPRGDVTAGIAGIGEILIPHYKNTSFHKSLSVTSVTKIANTSGNQRYYSMTGFWRSTSAVSKIVLTPDANFEVGSIFSLYGII